jgi:RNA polymerase sigma factor (sigma-70 family)
MPKEREAKLLWDAEERGYVLGAAFKEALREIASGGIDLVCFTGDFADWGHPNEYAAATTRLHEILETIGVPRDRFFAVPGNHDVQRTVHKDAWDGVRNWLADGHHNRGRLGRWFRHVERAPAGVKSEWREHVLLRTEEFWKWLDSFRGNNDLRPCTPKLLGYRHTLPRGTFKDIELPIHIVGLDSAWLCGADREQGAILVTDEQVLGHIREGAKPLDGLRIGLVHHPLDHLADHHEVRRLLADNGVDLLLHGHQHVPLAMVTDEPGARLRVLAAGCLMEGDLGKNWPNAFQLIEVDVVSRGGAVHFRKWARNARFWAKGSDIYRDASDGVLTWAGTTAPWSPEDAARAVVKSEVDLEKFLRALFALRPPEKNEVDLEKFLRALSATRSPGGTSQSTSPEDESITTLVAIMSPALEAPSHVAEEVSIHPNAAATTGDKYTTSILNSNVGAVAPGLDAAAHGLIGTDAPRTSAEPASPALGMSSVKMPTALADVERDLVELAKTGDRAALGKLLRSYGPSLFREVLLPRLGNTGDAQDALMDTYVRIIQFPSSEWPQTGFYPWLRALALRVALDLLRKKKRSMPLEPEAMEAEAASEIARGDEEFARKRVEDALCRINPRYAQAIRMRVLEERPREEVATELGVSIATVDVLIHRAIAALRKALGPDK